MTSKALRLMNLIGSALLIANRQSAAALSAAQAPMELDDVADDASMPVGSMLAFCRQGDAVVVTDLGGVAVLRPEFVGRLRA